MCVPFHSVVQYGDFQLNGGGILDGAHSVLSQLGYAKRIGNFYHFSKLGGGHSIATRYKAKISYYISEGSNWEGAWWNGFTSKIAKDTPFSIPRSELPDAEHSANLYYDAVCMKNMRVWRNFVIKSIESCDDGGGRVGYLCRFKSCLTPAGLIQFENRIASNLGAKHRFSPKATIPVIGWASRKRGLFKDCFADFPAKW